MQVTGYDENLVPTGFEVKVPGTVRDINRIIGEAASEQAYLRFVNSNLPKVLQDKLISEKNIGSAPICHFGYDAQALPEIFFFRYVFPCHLYGLEPNNETGGYSWKLNFDGLLLSTREFLNAGTELLDPAFQQLEMAALDLGHRLLREGVVMKKIASSGWSIGNAGFSAFDQFLFVKRNTSAKWFGWVAFRLFWLGKWGQLKTFVQAWNKNPQLHSQGIIKHMPAPSVLISPEIIQEWSISVILITLNRFHWLERVVEQLNQQEVLPREIIIIHHDTEREEAYLKLQKKSEVKLVVKRAKVLGQCSQRNQGIELASGKLLYFVDDDMEELLPDHLKHHLSNLMALDADVSSGVPDEVGIAPIRREKLNRVISDVFPTNDSLAKKECINQAGWFDIAMDRGQSEDHELGLRLYKSGALMIKDPNIKSLHLRAPSGGLRVHGARKVTYSGSKDSLFRKRILHRAEIYMNLKHFPLKEVNEMIWISLFTTFFSNGSIWRKMVKAVFSFLTLPVTIYKLLNRLSWAKAQLKHASVNLQPDYIN